MTAAHHYRSPLLGEPVSLAVPQGTIEAFVRGNGPPIVFTHGWLANANLWRNVVDRVAGEFTCVALDLPFGAHRVPLDADADLTAAGCGTLVCDALDALGHDGVTLVGNDSGGAYSQIALAQRDDRVARLVLTSCETPFDSFPPALFDRLPGAARDVEVLGALLAALQDPHVRKLPVAFGLLVKHPLAREISDAYALPSSRDPGVLRDVAKAMVGASTDTLHTAAHDLIDRWARPTLFVWSREDPVFPIEHARRYATALADARLVEVDDCFSFTAEDQPAAVAHAIGEFLEVPLMRSA